MVWLYGIGVALLIGTPLVFLLDFVLKLWDSKVKRRK